MSDDWKIIDNHKFEEIDKITEDVCKDVMQDAIFEGKKLYYKDFDRWNSLSDMIDKAYKNYITRSTPYDNIDRDFIKRKFLEQGGRCALTGIQFQNFRQGTQCWSTNPLSCSIDKIDSTKYYTRDNVRLVTTQVNFALNEFGEKMFDLLVDSRIEYRKINNK